MPTLVLSPRYTDDSRSLGRAAIAAGWSVERLLRWQVSDQLKSEEAVVYGEPLFAEAIAEALDLALITPPFDWLIRLSESYTKRAVSLHCLGDVRHLDRVAFIKPADDKAFPPKVYEAGADVSDLLPDTLPVLVSEPATWEKEFRAFVLEGNAATISPYARAGDLAQADDGSWPATDAEIEEARAFLATLLADPAVSIPAAVVIDVGVIAERGWAVVEANSASSAGIYGCDPAQVLLVVRRACRSRNSLRVHF